MTRDRDGLARTVLARAAAQVGLPSGPAELIRDGSNTLYAVPGGVVARIGPPGSVTPAQHQLAVARWLQNAGVRVVTPLSEVPQPTVVDDIPVTWWRQIPPHRHATPAEMGSVLRQLHALPRPEVPALPDLDPFDGLDAAAADRSVLTSRDRTRLQDLIASLRDRYAAGNAAVPTSVVHGDAWQGNIAVPHDGSGPVLLDLDHVAVGPRDWDLVPLAVDRTDFARISEQDYQDFVRALGGSDVTGSTLFGTLALLTEIKWIAFAIRKAGDDPDAAAEVRHRLDCLHGEVSKPWTWTAL